MRMFFAIVAMTATLTNCTLSKRGGGSGGGSDGGNSGSSTVSINFVGGAGLGLAVDAAAEVPEFVMQARCVGQGVIDIPNRLASANTQFRVGDRCSFRLKSFRHVLNAVTTDYTRAVVNDSYDEKDASTLFRSAATEGRYLLVMKMVDTIKPVAAQNEITFRLDEVLTANDFEKAYQKSQLAASFQQVKEPAIDMSLLVSWDACNVLTECPVAGSVGLNKSGPWQDGDDLRYRIWLGCEETLANANYSTFDPGGTKTGDVVGGIACKEVGMETLRILAVRDAWGTAPNSDQMSRAFDSAGAACTHDSGKLEVGSNCQMIDVAKEKQKCEYTYKVRPGTPMPLPPAIGDKVNVNNRCYQLDVDLGVVGDTVVEKSTYYLLVMYQEGKLRGFTSIPFGKKR